MHGGRAPQVVAAAQARLAEAEATRRLRADGYEPTVSAVEELLSLGAEVTALKDVLRARVASLSNEEWLTTSKPDVEEVQAVTRAYERALDRCERTLTNMLRLDLQSRKVRLSERDADAIWRAVEAGLTAINPIADRQAFRTVFAEALRDLSSNA